MRISVVASVMLALSAASVEAQVAGWGEGAVVAPSATVAAPTVQPRGRQAPSAEPVPEALTPEIPSDAPELPGTEGQIGEMPEVPPSMGQETDEAAEPEMAMPEPDAAEDSPSDNAEETAPEMPEGITLLSATDPEAIRQAVSDAGLSAELTTDDYGDPMIVSSTSRSNFWVLFFGCTDGQDCSEVQFYIGYTLDSAVPAETLDQFNASHRFVRTFSFDGGVAMAMDLKMPGTGVEGAIFDDYLQDWLSVVPDWEVAMGV